MILKYIRHTYVILLKNTRNIKLCGRHVINRYNKYTFNVPDFTLRQHGNDYGNTNTRHHVIVFNYLVYFPALRLLKGATTKLKEVIHTHSIDLANLYDRQASIYASMGK